jgi:hypothetical protein
MVGLALAFFALRSLMAVAHETDQYTLPVGREFADLGPHLSRVVHGAIVEAVNGTNASIRRSLRDAAPKSETARLQSEEMIAGEVWLQLFTAFPVNESLDAGLASQRMHALYPGLITAYRPEQSIYEDPVLMLDVTKVVRTLARACTVNAGGNLVGTDKIIHFLNLGHIYYSTYLSARKRGQSESEAVSEAVQLSAGNNFFLSENALLGMLTTGIRSNADLAANYAGFKFYRNLTEEVHIGNRIMPPMLSQEGLYWRLNAQVRPDSDFFTAFITPHWNEALNPNVYGIASRARLRVIVRSRCPDLLDWYRDERGRRLNQEQFGQIEAELSTFYGEAYGYASDGANTVSIASTCFQSGKSADVRGDSAEADPGNLQSQNVFGLQIGWGQHAGVTPAPAFKELPATAVDAFGRTPLWWAAKNGRVDEVEMLLAQGASPNAADIDGETPLHAAARWGRVAVVEVLLVHGADPGSKALYGITPLQVAVMEAQVDAARALLRRTVDVNARNVFGEIRETVLDPFGGSGTTFTVAKKLDRRFLGFELSEKYAGAIRERLANIAVGDPLEGAPEPLVSAPSTANGITLKEREQNRRRFVRKQKPTASDQKRLL